MTKLSLLLPRRSESTPVFKPVRELLRQTELTSYGKNPTDNTPEGQETRSVPWDDNKYSKKHEK